MKKGIKIFILLMLALFLIGGVLIIVGVANGGSMALNIDHKNKKVYTNSKLYEGVETPDSIKNIDIHIDVADINIKRGDSYKIEYHFRSYNTPIIKTENDTFIIDTSPSNEIIFNYNFDFSTIKEDNYINITVPENADLSNTKLNVDVGNINIDSVNNSSLNIDLDTGKLNLANANIDDLVYDLNTGDTTINSITGTKLSGDIDTGKFDMTNSTINAVTITDNTGNISVSESKVSDININSDTGLINLSLIGEESDYSIKADIDTGSITVNGKKMKDSYQVDAGKNKIIIDSDTGSVNIDFK